MNPFFVAASYRANLIALCLESLGIDNGLVKVIIDGYGIYAYKIGATFESSGVPPTRKEDVVTSFSIGETIGHETPLLPDSLVAHDSFQPLDRLGRSFGHSHIYLY